MTEERGNSFVTVDPVYRVVVVQREETAAAPGGAKDHGNEGMCLNPLAATKENGLDACLQSLLEQAVQRAQSVPNCWSFGYCRPVSATASALLSSSLIVQGRQYFPNAQSVLDFYAQVHQNGRNDDFESVLVDSAVTSPSLPLWVSIQLKRLRVTGPREALQLLQSNPKFTDHHCGAPIDYLSTVPGGFSNLRLLSEPRSHSHVTVYPLFAVSDWDRCLLEFVEPAQELTKPETGCLFYGFCRSDSHLFCREIFVDGPSTVLHMDAVKHLIQALLRDGILTPVYFSILGPADQLEAVRPALEYLNPMYQEVAAGFDRLERL